MTDTYTDRERTEIAEPCARVAENEALLARSMLALALDRVDGEHSSSLVECARRAAELLAGTASIERPDTRAEALELALRAMVRRVRRVGGHADHAEQQALWDAERLLDRRSGGEDE